MPPDSLNQTADHDLLVKLDTKIDVLARELDEVKRSMAATAAAGSATADLQNLASALADAQPRPK